MLNINSLAVIKEAIRVFFEITISETQFNTTRCSGKLNILSTSAANFVVTLGCPEAEILTVSLSENTTNMSSRATGAVLTFN